MSACKDCKHLLNMLASPWRKEPSWYDLFCGASYKPKIWNPYTGKMEEPIPKYLHCRDVNKGPEGYDCDRFEEKDD